MPTPAEEEAQRIMQAVRFDWAEPIGAQEAADHVLDLAERIRAERARAKARPVTKDRERRGYRRAAQAALAR